MKAKTIFINLLVIVVLLGIIELVCRYVLSQVYNRSFDSTLIEAQKYGTSDGLKANVKGVVWGEEFSTDEIGGRRTESKAGKKKRLYIGDSVTEGVGVDDSSTFAYRVSVINANYDTRNISLIGYSTADYLNVINRYVGTDTSIESIAIFYCLNDIYGKTSTKDLPVMSKQNLFGKINGLLQNDYATYKLLKLFVYQNSDSYYRYDMQFYHEDSTLFKNAMADLKTCDSISKAKGIKLSLVLLPYRLQLLREYNRTPQLLVAKYCRQNGIAYHDAAQYLGEDLNHGDFYLFADEIHFSAKGHQKIAEYLKTIGF